MRAPPRQAHIRIAERVQPHGPRLRMTGELLQAANVAAPCTSGEAERRAVGDAQRILVVLELDDAHHRPEDFLLRDAHLVLDIREHRGLDVEAARADPLAAGRERRALLPADVDIAEDAVHLLLGDHRAKHRGAIRRIADLHGPRAGRETLDHFIVDLLVGEHTWPALKNTPDAADLVAAAMSASSKITLADLPPNSSETCLKLLAAPFMMPRPTPGEPVNVTLSTSGWLTSASPTTRPEPATMLSTPAGTTASRASSAIRSAESEVSSTGFITTVQPQASAGASFHIPIIIGKFHGTMAATTPTGSRTV